MNVSVVVGGIIIMVLDGVRGIPFPENKLCLTFTGREKEILELEWKPEGPELENEG